MEISTSMQAILLKIQSESERASIALYAWELPYDE